MREKLCRRVDLIAASHNSAAAAVRGFLSEERAQGEIDSNKQTFRKCQFNLRPALEESRRPSEGVG